MAPLPVLPRPVFLLVLFLLTSSCLLAVVSEAQHLGGRRRAVLAYRRNLHKIAPEEDGWGDDDDEGETRLPAAPKKKPTTSTAGGGSLLEKPAGSKNKTLLIKTVKPKKTNSTSTAGVTAKKGLGSSSVSSTSLLSSKATGSSGGGSGLDKTKTAGTKPPKPSNSTAASKLLLKPIKPTKLNSTAGIAKAPKTGLKALNSTAKAAKKLGDLMPKAQNKTAKATTTTTAKTTTSKSSLPTADGKNKKTTPQQQKKPEGGDATTTTKNKDAAKRPHGPTKPTQILPWLDVGGISGDYGTTDDLISEFRDLPSKFHSALVPDFHRIKTTSKAYLTHANKEFAKTFKPLVGTKYAPSAATAASATTILLPLLLAALLIRCLHPHLPLQKLLLSIHIYLAIYFATLALTAALTGHEPLRFFHAASPRFYAATQVLQTLGYALYLLLQLVHVAAGGRLLGALQLLVGVAVGLHYYTAVFHRAVVGEPPRTNWRVHAVYAVLFAGVCALARAERRKKAYLGVGGREDGKKS